MIYKIGIIEDDITEASETMLTLVKHSDRQVNEESFKLYKLGTDPNYKNVLFEEIEEDIINNEIQCLIVDYKLDISKEVLKGNEIVDHIHTKVPDFPMVILTNVPDQGKNDDLADPDKVYAKRDFLKLDGEQAREMVYNILRNIKRYSERRSNLELKRDQLVDEIVSNQYEENTYFELMETERNLQRYIPIDLSFPIEKDIHDNAEEALKVLKEYRELMK